MPAKNRNAMQPPAQQQSAVAKPTVAAASGADPGGSPETTEQQPPLKKQKTPEGDVVDSGAPQQPPAQPLPSAPPPPPLFQANLIEQLVVADSLQTIGDRIRTWGAEAKAYVDGRLIAFLRGRPEGHLSFDVPSTPMLIPPLRISDAAASGPGPTSFREVMCYSNLHKSFAASAQYEAAGTVWMLDAVSDTGLSADRVTVSQLEAAANFWSPDTFARSSLQPLARRYFFDVPIPAQVVDAQVAQRAGGDGSPETDGVLFAKAVPVISGRAVVLSWYAAMAEALQTGHDERAMKLFEAALSVPIRLRLMPDFESCQLASLSFQETASNATAASGACSFWHFATGVSKLSKFEQGIADNLSYAKLMGVLKSYGLTHKGKPITDHALRSLKALTPFVCSDECWSSMSLAEPFCPELRDSTLLLQLAAHSSARGAGAAAAAASGADQAQQFSAGAHAARSLAFVFDCMRAFRIVGDFPKRDVYTVAKLTGAEKKTGLIHQWLKHI